MITERMSRLDVFLTENLNIILLLFYCYYSKLLGYLIILYYVKKDKKIIEINF